jgi:hypothetical protein
MNRRAFLTGAMAAVAAPLVPAAVKAKEYVALPIFDFEVPIVTADANVEITQKVIRFIIDGQTHDWTAIIERNDQPNLEMQHMADQIEHNLLPVEKAS